MKAVILSDDSAFADQASSILQCVGRQQEVGVCWTITTWSMISLRHSAISEKALLEAADAHLILIPGAYARSLPLHLRSWLERWAAIRLTEDAAVGVVDIIDSGVANEVSLELKHLIESHGLSLITKNALAEPRVNRFVSFSVEHEQPLPIRLAHLFLLLPIPDPFRDFGIND